MTQIKELLFCLVLLLFFYTGNAQPVLSALEYDWHISGGSNSSEESRGVSTDAQGNVYIIGRFTKTFSLNTGSANTTLTFKGGSDIFLIKYNNKGEYQWAFALGGAGYDEASAIATDAEGNVYITGAFDRSLDFDPSAGTALYTPKINDAFVAKYTSTGVFAWVIVLGSNNNDYGKDIQVSRIGDVYVTGNFSGGLDFDPGPAQATLPLGGIYVARYSNDGSYISAYAINSTLSSWADALTLDNQDNVLITGIHQGTTDFDIRSGTANLTAAPGLGDAFVAKYSADLTYSWAFQLGNSEEEHGNDIITDISGNVYLTGSYNGSIDFDPSGAVQNRTGNNDLFLAKYTTTGTYQWVITVGEGYPGNSQAYLSLDDFNNVYLTGRFTGTEDFDPDPAGVYNLTSGASSMFIAKYGATGGLIGASKLLVWSFASGLATDRDNNLYVAGTFDQTQDIDPSETSEVIVKGMGSYDFFLFHSSTFHNFREVVPSPLTMTVNNAYSHAWADFDNDGDQDVIVGDSEAGFTLYQNQDKRKFSKSNGLLNSAIAVYSSTWGDLDNDGNLDLFVAENESGKASTLFANNGDGTFSQATTGDLLLETSNARGSSWADYDGDGFLDLLVTNWHISSPEKTSSLYGGHGNGTFTKVANTPLSNDIGMAASAASWCDYDDDGNTDIFVGATNKRNLLYKNLGDGTFMKVEDNSLTTSSETTAVAWADYDNDGFTDVYLSRNTHDVLYKNDGQGGFEAVSVATFDAEHSVAATWGDYDNDGDLDLYLANGGPARKNSFLRNDGEGKFTKLNDPTTASATSSKSTSWVDIDGDGDLDLFVTNADAGNKLFENPGNKNHWLEIKLRGTKSNRSGVGAKIRVKTADGWQLRDVFSQQGTTLVAHVGLGSNTQAAIVRIEWPSGVVQVLQDLKSDQIITITEQETPNTPHATAALTFDGNEDFPITFDALKLAETFSDNEGDRLSAIVITELPTGGTFFLNDIEIAINESLPITETATLKFVPLPDWNGTATVTFDAVDDRGLHVSSHVSLNIHPVNDAPMFIMGDIETLEDFTGTITLTPQTTVPEDELDQTLTYTLSPSEADVVTLQLDAASGVVSLTAVPNFHGTENFTLTANDGQAENAEYKVSFSITIHAVNDPPIISKIDDIFLYDTDASGSVEFTVQDPDTEQQQLLAAVTSGNKTLLPNDSIVLTRNETQWTLTMALNGEQGATPIEVQLTDGENIVHSSFILHIGTVTSVEENNAAKYIHLSPNPATTHISITFERGKSRHLKHYSIVDSKGGAIGYEKMASDNDTIVIPVQHLDQGLYLVHLSLYDGTSHAIKFLKH